MKVYVVGNSTSYASWIDNLVLVDTMKEADVVLFTGGSDIGSHLYNEKPNRSTHPYPERDIYEVEEYHKAVALNKVLWGTCRGLQLIGALNGAKLIQDLNHPSEHTLVFYDGSKCKSNSIHHQMVYPYNLKEKEDYWLLAWTQSLSRYYSNTLHNDMSITELDDQGFRKEPEMLYFPKTKGIGFQGHPEWMDNDSKMVKIGNAFLKQLVDGRLEDSLKANISVKDICEEYDIQQELEEKEVVSNEL